MILALDVGNTNIKIALFNQGTMIHYWRVATIINRTHDEYGITLLMLMQAAGVAPEDVEGIIMSSVVPSVNFTMEHMCKDYFHRAPMLVAPGIKTGIRIRYENPRDLGSDRIANAVAVHAEYGGPAIFIDFGTATSYGVLSAAGEFLGGAIGPGVQLSAQALFEHTARLPKIELVKPATAIQNTTVTNMQAGIVFGYVGQVEYIVGRMRAELGDEKTRVIATGGLARLISSESSCIDVLDGELTLKGLLYIYQRNAPMA